MTIMFTLMENRYAEVQGAIKVAHAIASQPNPSGTTSPTLSYAHLFKFIQWVTIPASDSLGA